MNILSKLDIKRTIALAIVLMAFTQCSSESKEKTMENNKKEEACCKAESSNSQSETSEITCPECGFTKTEVLPTDVCTIVYTCEKCQTELTPKEGDCCVYCTYGTHKCPSKQTE
jgi:hypothetical protein